MTGRSRAVGSLTSSLCNAGDPPLDRKRRINSAYSARGEVYFVTRLLCVVVTVHLFFFVTCFCDSLLLKHCVEAAARLVKSIDHAGSSTTNYCGHHLNPQTALDLYRNAYFIINLVKVSLPHVLGVICFPSVANAECIFATAYHLHVFFFVFFFTSIYLDISNVNPYSCGCKIVLNCVSKLLLLP